MRQWNTLASRRITADTVRLLVRRLVSVSLACAFLWLPAPPVGALIADRAEPTKVRFTGPSPARGRVLIATRALRDPRFSRTVILLVEFGDQGAVGVIINHPTRISLAAALPDIEAAGVREDPVYRGGPVGRDHLLLLVRAPEPPENSSRVLDGLYLSASLDTLRQALGAGRTFHAYAGYTGWAPGQLEGEIARGDWIVGEGDSAMVFEAAPQSLWPRLIERNSGQSVRRWTPYRGSIIGIAADARP